MKRYKYSKAKYFVKYVKKKTRKNAIVEYSAKGTKGKWRYASSKARLKYATNRR